MHATRSFLLLPLLATAPWFGMGCAPRAHTTPPAGKTTDAAELTASEVAQAVEVTSRDGSVIYRAPRLSSARPVDVRRGGPVVGQNLGVVALGQSGFLFGIRSSSTGQVSHHAAFQSDFVNGTNRFRAVTLPDGTTPKFRVVPSDQKHCQPTCSLVFETLVVDLPEASLRSAITSGLTLSITLDNGTLIKATAPASYVEGYLSAVDARR